MAEKKTQDKKTLSKGDCLACEVCGLSVTIDENHAYTEDSVLVCCGKPMKQKAKKVSASNK
jgi:hypothetical protein